MENLVYIPKHLRTKVVLEMGLRKNGCQIKILDEDEITEELVHIAIEQNGFAYTDINEKYKTKELLRKAIVSTNGMLISEYMDGCELDEDLQYLLLEYGYGYLYSVANLTQDVFDSAFNKHSSGIIQDFISYRDRGCYEDLKQKYLKYRHIIQYFERMGKYGYCGSHIYYLDSLTDDVNLNLMLDIYKVAPIYYEYFKTIEGFDAFLRKHTIDLVLEEIK